MNIPLRVENGERVDETPVHTALREELANCLINADYYGTRGLIVIRTKMESPFPTLVRYRLYEGMGNAEAHSACAVYQP